MNQFKAGDTNAVVLAGMCTALAVVLSMVGFYVPGSLFWRCFRCRCRSRTWGSARV